MADTYDISTLLPTQSLQRIAQHFGSPSFTPTSNAATTSNRVALYLMTGRVPSAAEFYYGAYLDRVGDTHKTIPLSLSDRSLGYIAVTPSRDTNVGESTYSHSRDILLSGARWPDGVTFTPSNANYDPQPLAPSAMAEASWMLDWSFSANKQALLAGGNRTNLRNYRDNGDLVGNGAPTWFFISDDYNFPMADSHLIKDHNNSSVARLDVLRNGFAERRPIIFGTVGTLGSGADLELASGGDELSETVSPVSLRILLQDPAPEAPAEPTP